MSVLGIMGAGGHGREAHTVARAAIEAGAPWTEVVLFDDGPVDADRLARIGVDEVYPSSELAERCDGFVIAIGDPAIRARVARSVEATARATRLVSPDASIGSDVELDGGVMVYGGATITTNVRIGPHSHVNAGCVVSHDVRIGAAVSLSPGALLNGEVVVEDGAFIGTGAIVLPGRTVGQGAVVAAGAVVVDDVAPEATVIGVPAR